MLVDGDRDELLRFYPNIESGITIRAIVHNHVKKLQERESREGKKHDLTVHPDELPEFGLGEGSDDGEHGTP